MTRTLVALLALIFVTPAGPRSAADDRPGRAIPGWGESVDPGRDCQIKADGGRLSIAVPGTKHDLSAEAGDLNAPRVLGDVSGDFIAQVKVSGNIRHAGKSTSARYVGYHGAGLLLWQDARTYLRLERAAVLLQDGRVVHYVNLELRKDGQNVAGAATSAEIPDRDTYLRIERRGRRLQGLVSEDGVKWLACRPIDADLPVPLKLGVAAVSTSTEPFTAVFADLEVFTKGPKPAAR